MSGLSLDIILETVVVVIMLLNLYRSERVAKATIKAAETTINAAKVSELANRRREHDNRLTSVSLDTLRNSIWHYKKIFEEMWINTRDVKFEISPMKIEWRSRVDELLCEHLEMGYPDLFKSIFTYQKSYNKNVQTFIDVLQEGISLLVSQLDSYRDICSVDSSLESFCASIVNSFRESYINRVHHGYSQARDHAHVEKGVLDWGMGDHAAKVLSGMDDRRIQDVVNSTFDPSKKYYKKLLTLYSNAKSTEKDYNEIISALDKIRESILAGSHLEGWCKEGVNAGYEQPEE